MTAIKRLLATIALLFVLGAGCTSQNSSECPNRGSADPEGHLLRICRYIREKNIDVSPGDPATYTIKRIENRNDGGKEVLWVFLNCCYLGDIAVIDKATGDVLSFRPGAQ